MAIDRSAWVAVGPDRPRQWDDEFGYPTHKRTHTQGTNQGLATLSTHYLRALRLRAGSTLTCFFAAFTHLQPATEAGDSSQRALLYCIYSLPLSSTLRASALKGSTTFGALAHTAPAPSDSKTYTSRTSSRTHASCSPLCEQLQHRPKGAWTFRRADPGGGPLAAAVEPPERSHEPVRKKGAATLHTHKQGLAELLPGRAPRLWRTSGLIPNLSCGCTGTRW